MKHIAACNLAKTTLTHWCFLRFLNSRNGTKSRKASHLIKDMDYGDAQFAHVILSSTSLLFS